MDSTRGERCEPREMQSPQRSPEQTAAPFRSSGVARFDGAFFSSVTGAITAGRLSLSSVVRLE
jgi:hypothetical protein